MPWRFNGDGEGDGGTITDTPPLWLSVFIVWGERKSRSLLTIARLDGVRVEGDAINDLDDEATEESEESEEDEDATGRRGVDVDANALVAFTGDRATVASRRRGVFTGGPPLPGGEAIRTSE